jgi:hypothetical protein
VGSRLAVAAVVLLVLVAAADALRGRGGSAPEPAPPPATARLDRADLSSLFSEDALARARNACPPRRDTEGSCAVMTFSNETGTDP